MTGRMTAVIAAGAICIVACTGMTDLESAAGITAAGMETVTFRFLPASPEGKAINPEENLVHDINIFIFNEYGLLQERHFIEKDEIIHEGNCHLWHTTLLKNCRYTIYACANTGSPMDISSIVELLQYRYYLAYPDDYRAGMPMSGNIETVVSGVRDIDVPLSRLMARVSLCIDRSRMDDDVEFNVRSVIAGGCPRSVTPFSASSVSGQSGFFPAGFVRKDIETDPLNTENDDGRSGEIHLYLLENRQGELLPGNTDEKDKFFPAGDPRAERCSFIEMRIEYMSAEGYSLPGKYLVYRFYIGNGPGNFDVCRNTDYRITVIPEGDCLGASGWRIESDAIFRFIERIDLNYSSVTMTYEGEKIYLEPFISPEDADDSSIGWATSDDMVASVSWDGTVTARGEGECEIRCEAADGSGTSAACKVKVKFAPYYMKVYPGNYIRCKAGDSIVVGCDYFPPETPFDIGVEELEFDKERGIYDYRISEDGKTVTITTKARGSGMLYMETGAPVNQAELIVLVID